MRVEKENKNGTGGAKCVGGETSEEMFARFDKAEKEEVYCKDCIYYEKIIYNFCPSVENCNASANLKPSGNYYTTYPIYLEDPETINKTNNCKYYKRKWWKFWTKESKRKILKGAQPKTDAGPKPDPRLISYAGLGMPKRRKNEKTKLISADFVKGYLDGCITKWRNELGISKTKEDKLIAKCNIDVFQSVRVSLLGELLPKEKK